MNPNRSSSPSRSNFNAEDFPDKPYELVSFPSKAPTLDSPSGHHGHHLYAHSGYHGTLQLSLSVKTALHVSTGITVMGSDIGSKEPLIKTMTQGKNEHLVIQGSSLKGCVRSVYEAITNSTLGAITQKYEDKIPQARRRCTDKNKLCPACLVFGALGWQGLVHFTDARCTSAKSAVGFMPSLYGPSPKREAYFDKRKVAGRKFYYHAREAVDSGTKGTPMQQAGTEYTFKTALQFLNLSQAQLGTLLIALGQDKDNPIALKLGGGKPVGLGTVQVQVSEAEVMQDVRDRYTHYEAPAANKLTGEPLAAFMQSAVEAAHSTGLVESEQLLQLSNVLRWPTNREAPTGMY